MEEILELLRDGKARSLKELCEELELSESDIKRTLEFLEHNGLVNRVGLDNIVWKIAE